MKLFAKKPMTIPLRAMVWEYRQPIDMSQVMQILVYSAIALLCTPAFSNDKIYQNPNLDFFLFECGLAIGILAYCNDTWKFISTCNRWKYTLPIKTRKLISSQFFIIGLSLEIMHLACWAGFTIFHQRFYPLFIPMFFWPVIFYCRFMVVRVAAVSLSISIVLGIISIAGGVYLLNPIIQNIIPFMTVSPDYFGLTYFSVGAGLIGLSLGATIWATSLDRQGICFEPIKMSLTQLRNLNLPRIKTFRSPFWAFAWFEFMRNVWWIPLGSLILACLGHRVAYYALFPYPIIAPLAGLIIIGRMNPKSTDPCIDSFRGCLPASERDFIFAKTLVILGSVLLGAIPLITMAYTELTRWDYRLQGIIVYFLLASLGGWILFTQIFTLFLRSGNENQWIYSEPIFYILILVTFFSSDITLLIIGFFVFLYILGNTHQKFKDAQQYGLASQSVKFWAGVIWFALTLFVYWVLYLTDIKWDTSFLIAPALLLLTVSPVAALPLAMWHNRHR